jgi:hypothetical protein
VSYFVHEEWRVQECIKWLFVEPLAEIEGLECSGDKITANVSNHLILIQIKRKLSLELKKTKQLLQVKLG